ncbi:hypothetical protein HOG21_05210 [bacterium]|nr:hypothetical protein [bacterium]
MCIKNNCHHLSNSFFQASKINLSSKAETIVETDCLPTGGVVNIETLFTQFRAIFRLLGIGVADIDNMSIFHLSFLILSLSFTQNLCSSSTTKTHKSLNSISSLNNLCVHITKSIFHSFNFCKVTFTTLAFSNLVITPMFIGKGLNLSIAFS